MSNKLSVSDYSNFDYKKDFWQKGNRVYEDICEQKTLSRLLKSIPHKVDVLMDSGCGFGRLFPAYANKADTFILMDYAENMLSQAKEALGDNKNIAFLKGNLYSIPLKDNSVDVFVSVRTLHHITKPEIFFSEVRRVLKPNGYFILEIPNKRHFLNILKFLFLFKANPFTKAPLHLSESFVNYHPKHILNLLKSNNLQPRNLLNTSFFRIPILKRLLPTSFLCFLDGFFQFLFSWLNLTPSVFVLCKGVQ